MEINNIYPLDLPKAYRERIEVDRSTGCWLWQGYIDRYGYGQATSMWREGIADYKIHILVYRLLIGDVPEGKIIHHNCQVKHCCNPSHLEALTPVEHNRWHSLRR